MSNVKWIKIVVDIFDDEKMLLIESMPENDGITVIWFKLLSLAGKINNGGILLLNDKLAYTDEMLATIFRKDIALVNLALKTFEDLDMIARVNEGFNLEDFKKVIDTKVKSWKGDNKMSAFLRPNTLFGNKFESYLNETIKTDNTEEYGW